MRFSPSCLPDLLLEGWLRAAWESPGSRAALEDHDGLALRLGFDTTLEAGLRSRLGRTLETTGTGVAEVVVGDEEWTRIVNFAAEAVQANAGSWSLNQRPSGFGPMV